MGEPILGWIYYRGASWTP